MVKKCPSCGVNNRDDATFCASCGTSFTAAPSATPTVKPVPSVRVVSPVGQPSAARVPSPGMCFYHPNLPAIYICNRCGRPICRDDAKSYNELILCPQCYMMVPPPTYYPPAPPPRKPIWGFIISLVAGIMIILNAAALLSQGFYNMWTGIFPWIIYFGAFPPWILFAVGIILGVITCIGAVLIIIGYETIGSVVVFPVAIISLIIGGGFIAGFALGIVAGILAMLGR